MTSGPIRPRGPAPAIDPDTSAPGLWQLLLEARAPLEAGALLAASPWLARLPVGDGHPVIVYPGLGASDLSTLALRRFLAHRGYTAYPWRQGLNLGPRSGVVPACRRQLAEVAARHREEVSLVGWSLGGVYARELAKEHAAQVRCVITLGTPFAGDPRATNAWRFYRIVSGQPAHDPERHARLREAPPVPTTSIFSKSDGVVAWRCSLNDEAPHTENIQLYASHVGMGLNPLALYAIADRLAQDPRRWRKFDAGGARSWFYKVTHAAPPAAATR